MLERSQIVGKGHTKLGRDETDNPKNTDKNKQESSDRTTESSNNGSLDSLSNCTGFVESFDSLDFPHNGS